MTVCATGPEKANLVEFRNGSDGTRISPECLPERNACSIIVAVLPESLPAACVQRWAWSSAGAPCGLGRVLIARDTDTAWVIAPPSVLLRPGEHEQLNDWRVARWYAANPERLVITPGDHVRGSYQEVTVDEIHLMVPEEFRGWVKGVGKRQRALADGFGRQSPGLPPREDHVRAAAQLYRSIAGPKKARRQATKELWSDVDDMPDNVDELLRRASGVTTHSAKEIASASAAACRAHAPWRFSSRGLASSKYDPETGRNTDGSGSTAGAVSEKESPGVLLAVATFVVAAIWAAGTVVAIATDSGNPNPAWHLLGLLFVLILSLSGGDVRSSVRQATEPHGTGNRAPVSLVRIGAVLACFLVACATLTALHVLPWSAFEPTGANARSSPPPQEGSLRPRELVRVETVGHGGGPVAPRSEHPPVAREQPATRRRSTNGQERLVSPQSVLRVFGPNLSRLAR